LLRSIAEAVQANLETISKSYLSVALNSDQTASASDYIDALTALTSSHPSVWTEHYKSKTTVDRRLRQFLKKGSQLSSRDFWPRLTDVLKAVPSEVLPSNAADAAELLGALQGGIVRKDEPKYNHAAAFGTYLEVVALVNARLPDEDKSKLLEEMVLPLLEQYLRPSLETSQWSIPSNATKLLSQAMHVTGMAATLGERWPTFAQQLVDAIRTSAPEKSKDYEKSQNAVVQHTTQFATLQEQALKVDEFAPLQPVFAQATALIVAESISVLKNRNGKPFGAAGAVAALLSRKNAATSQTPQDIEAFVCNDLPDLILSPSSTYLVDILYAVSDSPIFKDAWSSTLKTVLKESDTPAKTKALEAILTSSRIPSPFDLASTDTELQQFVVTSVREAVEGTLEWDSFNRILQSRAKIIAPETTDEILAYLTESLSISTRAPYSLQGLRQIVRSNPSMLREFVATPRGTKLLQSLLLASESPSDEVAQGAAAVSASIQTVLASGLDSKQSIFSLIQDGLREATQTSVSVETLVDLAKQSIKAGHDWTVLQNVFPSVEDWDSALAPFLNSPPKWSLAITNPLAGAVYLVDRKSSPSGTDEVARDADGYSAAYRITLYVIRLLKNVDLVPIESVPVGVRDAYLRNVALTIQLADDNLGLAGANGIWADYNSDVESDAMMFMSDAQPFVTQELKRLSSNWAGDAATLLTWATDLLDRVEATTSAQAYYAARTYSGLIANAIEIAGWKNTLTSQLQDTLKSVRKDKFILKLIACLYAFREPLAASKSCERMCNEIIADLTGLKIEVCDATLFLAPHFVPPCELHMPTFTFEPLTGL
jgi:hypothetical protein